MFVQQRDEYLEHVCEMAIRKISIITIFGTLTNSTMKIDHYQLGEPKCTFLLNVTSLLVMKLLDLEPLKIALGSLIKKR